MLTEQDVRDARYAEVITKLATAAQADPIEILRLFRAISIPSFERGTEILKDYELRFSSLGVEELTESHAQELQGAVSPLVAVFSGYVGTVEKYTYAALFKKE